MRAILILFILIVGYIEVSLSLKLTFTPSDDEQLPLSAKYRDALRKLCKLIDEGKLPEEYTGKEDILKKQCIKLAKDDANISSSVSSLEKNSMLMIAGVASAVLYYAYNNELGTITKITRMIIDNIVRLTKMLVDQLSNIIKAISKPKPPPQRPTSSGQNHHSAPNTNSKTLQGNNKGNTMTTVEKSTYDPVKAREARLKRFAEESKKEE